MVFLNWFFPLLLFLANLRTTRDRPNVVLWCTPHPLLPLSCPFPLFPLLRGFFSLHTGKGHKLPSGPTGSLVGRRRSERVPDRARRVPAPPRWLPAAAAAGRLPAAGLPAAAATGRLRRGCAAARLPHHGGGAAARGLPAAAATAGVCRCPGAGVCKPAVGAAAKGQLDAAGVLFGAGRVLLPRRPLLKYPLCRVPCGGTGHPTKRGWAPDGATSGAWPPRRDGHIECGGSSDWSRVACAGADNAGVGGRGKRGRAGGRGPPARVSASPLV